MRNPPWLANWLLRRLAPVDDAVVGDLLEGYRRGRSALWYWRQVFAAIVIGSVREVRRHPFAVMIWIAVGWIVTWEFSTTVPNTVPHFVLDAGVRWYAELYYAHGGSGFPPWDGFFLLFYPTVTALANALGGFLAVRFYRGNRASMVPLYACSVFCFQVLLFTRFSLYYDASLPIHYGIDLATYSLVNVRLAATATPAAFIGGL